MGTWTCKKYGETIDPSWGESRYHSSVTERILWYSYKQQKATNHYEASMFILNKQKSRQTKCSPCPHRWSFIWKKCFAHMNEDGLGIVTSILTIIPVTSQWSLSFKSRAISWGFLHVDRRLYMHARRAAPEPEHTGMRFGLWCHFGDHMRRCGYAKRT